MEICVGYVSFVLVYYDINVSVCGVYEWNLWDLIR